MAGDSPDRTGPITGGAAERLRVALGSIGDEASIPRPFEQLVDDRPPSTTRGRLVRPMVMAAAAGCLAVVGAIVWLRPDEPGSIVTDDPPAAASEPSPRSNPGITTATSADDAVAATQAVDGPWYVIDLPAASPGLVSEIGSFPNGSSTSVWVSADGSYDEVLVLTRLASDRRGTTLLGEPGRSLWGVDGALNFVVTPDDAPDPDRASWVGDEMRWKRGDGSVWEFTSYGITPVLLSEHVLTLAEELEDGCPCTSRGLEFVGTDATPSVVLQQAIELDGTGIVLTRTTSPATDFAFTLAGLWRTTKPRAIDGAQGVVADGDQAVWRRDGFWFTLTNIPPERLDDVLTALRPLDLDGTVDVPEREGTEYPVCDRYTVQPGDHLAGIADSFDLTVDKLTAANTRLASEDLYPGTVLVIPC